MGPPFRKYLCRHFIRYVTILGGDPPSILETRTLQSTLTGFGDFHAVPEMLRAGPGLTPRSALCPWRESGSMRCER